MCALLGICQVTQVSGTIRHLANIAALRGAVRRPRAYGDSAVAPGARRLSSSGFQPPTGSCRPERASTKRQPPALAPVGCWWNPARATRPGFDRRQQTTKAPAPGWSSQAAPAAGRTTSGAHWRILQLGKQLRKNCGCLLECPRSEPQICSTANLLSATYSAPSRPDKQGSVSPQQLMGAWASTSDTGLPRCLRSGAVLDCPEAGLAANAINSCRAGFQFNRWRKADLPTGLLLPRCAAEQTDSLDLERRLDPPLLRTIGRA